ncbi:hypothetical protein HanRHA438_Chr09g0382891 [Helianthus annuus]|uniref:Uncharacterized protein n=1 Tax=Helianthus annuus TaxID=4232 RepID=A0A251TVK7_HELAN|nr:hypothetical protein HanXRQr2_Chr09g0371301 [Helianthus annuus]KAJ0524793.1 hypothetical protein HanHA300_Chr09g0304631 [Helianthus annuus]KAJ0532756.1 hypothetical protein HanIR_Chr09g0400541 [Helianthus annuus]KAJ0541166.1 hypothetical protein HanHA89_Chr09g0325371 [Helianthus annuus]KAJ0706248.1 hypothetical protein HanLR1_Chr09g0304871 [Helianthus annuus]
MKTPLFCDCCCCCCCEVLRLRFCVVVWKHASLNKLIAVFYLYLRKLTCFLFLKTGVTFFLCVLAITMLGTAVNAPTVMLANFLATPIALSLIIVFLWFGEFITGEAHFTLTADALKKVLTGKASNEILLSIVHTVAKLEDLITGAISRYIDVYLLKQFNRTKPNRKS